MYRKVMLRRGVVRAQFVGGDAHIDPRSYETKLGAPVGELSAKPTEGFISREKIRVNSEKKWWLCVVKR